MAWTRIANLTGIAAAMLLIAPAFEAGAQQPLPLPPVQGAPSSLPPPAKGKAASAAAAKAPTAPAAPKAPAKTEAAATGDGALRQRVDQVEEQLVDMQVMIGTLESLARSGGSATSASMARPSAAPAPGAYSSSEAARIDGLETQIRALTAQLEQLAEQVRALDGRRAAAPAVLSPAAGAPPPSQPRFGSTTVTPGGGSPGGAGGASGGDQIGGVLADTGQPPFASRPGQQPGSAGADPAASKQLYETAYGYLLQQDYGAAEAGFDDFLKRYPSDPLAANAQYWLGESFFVRGQFKPAAAAFLKGYQGYARSAKAPDSLLKLAMSLDRLGQRDAACSSYAELTTRFPNAPSHVKARAQTERQRIGCA